MGSFLWELKNLNPLDICCHVLCSLQRITWFLRHFWQGTLHCVYIRVLCSHRLRARLLTSKYHLILSKPLSIPCFELLLCVLHSRLIDSSQKALETEIVLENVCLWSDSHMALWWLKQVNKR